VDLEELKKRREELVRKFNEGADYLDALAARGKQDTPEFERAFAAWEQVNAAYMAVEDALECAAMTARIKQGS